MDRETSTKLNNGKTIETLQNLSDMSTKLSTYLTFTFKGSKHLFRFPTPIKLIPNRNYEIGLQYITTSNYLVNISEKNNKFIILFMVELNGLQLQLKKVLMK